MRSIVSSLSRLWSGWRRRPPPKAPWEAQAAHADGHKPPNQLSDYIEPAPPSSATTPPPAVEIEPPKPIPDDDREPEDDELEEAEDEAEDQLGADPFIATARPAPAEFSAEALEQRRSEALAAAQVGEHKISLSGLAGPGTLAEALNRLLQEGRVTAEFRDDEGEQPHLIYRQKR